MNGQLSIVQETLSRDKPIDTVYNNVLGWCCPKCGGISKLRNIKYCPGCGQRLNFLTPEKFNEKYPDRNN